MNKTLKNVLVTLSVLTAVLGAFTAAYFYFQKELKKVVFAGIVEPEELFTGLHDEDAE